MVAIPRFAIANGKRHMESARCALPRRLATARAAAIQKGEHGAIPDHRESRDRPGRVRGHDHDLISPGPAGYALQGHRERRSRDPLHVDFSARGFASSGSTTHDDHAPAGPAFPTTRWWSRQLEWCSNEFDTCDDAAATARPRAVSPLIEMIIAIIVMSIGIMGLAGTASYVAMQMGERQRANACRDVRDQNRRLAFRAPMCRDREWVTDEARCHHHVDGRR